MNSNTLEQRQVLWGDCMTNPLPLFNEKMLYATQESRLYQEKLARLDDCNMVLTTKHEIISGNGNPWKRIFSKAGFLYSSLFSMLIPKHLQSVPPPERRLYY